jgi:hypothetical protein
LSDLFYMLTVAVEGWCCTWSHLMTHTHTLGRTPLDEWSARRRDLYLTKFSTYKRETSLSPLGLGPEIVAREWLQTHALDRGGGNVEWRGVFLL